MRADNIIVESADEIGEKVVDATEKPGQLLSDLAHMYQKRGDANFKIEWHFDKRSVGKESEYLEAIKYELLNGKGGDHLRERLGFVGENEDLWDDALDEILSKLDDGFIKVLSET